MTEQNSPPLANFTPEGSFLSLSLRHLMRQHYYTAGVYGLATRALARLAVIDEEVLSSQGNFVMACHQMLVLRWQCPGHRGAKSPSC